MSVLGYHLRVLEQLGCIRSLAPDASPNGEAPTLYESRVADDEEIASILQATRQLDRSCD